MTGIVKGVADGTWIYLKNNEGSGLTPLLDSALVKKERFEFRGQLKDKVLQTMVGFKEPFYDADGTFKGYKLSDAAMLWLENSDVRLEGEKGSLEPWHVLRRHPRPWHRGALQLRFQHPQ